MAKEFVRPRMRGESDVRPVTKVSAEEGKAANLTGSSALPVGAIITFPWDAVELYKQPLQTQDTDGEIRYSYFLGCEVNGKNRTITAGTFTRTDFNGDGSVISPAIQEFVSKFDNPYDLGEALLGKTIKVVDQKRCNTEFNGVKRTVNYPVLEFVS